MYYIDTETAIEERPPIDDPGPRPDKKYYTGGDPARGIPATRADAQHMNVLQTEIANVVEAAGLPLEKGDDTQLLQAIPIVAGNPPMPRGHLYGLQIRQDEESSGSTLVFETGECRDALHKQNIVVASELIKHINSVWRPGNHAGGLALGAARDALSYHAFVLAKPNGDVDAGIDSSPDAKNLMVDPAVVAAGFTVYRRVGSVIASSDDLVMYGFSQDGDYFTLQPYVEVYSMPNPGTSGMVVPVGVPSGIDAMAVLRFSAEDSNPAGTTYYRCDPVTTPEMAVEYWNSLLRTDVVQQRAEVVMSVPVESGVDDQLLGEVRLQASRSNDAIRMRVTSVGWVDGRDKS